jgi:hypothetical protein
MTEFLRLLDAPPVGYFVVLNTSYLLLIGAPPSTSRATCAGSRSPVWRRCTPIR